MSGVPRVLRPTRKITTWLLKNHSHRQPFQAGENASSQGWSCWSPPQFLSPRFRLLDSSLIPVYESALAVNDLITAVLLIAQFSISRSRALLGIACGYLFTAAMVVAHALTFPGLFSPTGLLGAGPQSTAWLYMFWHAGFPLLVIAYGLLKDD